MGPKPRLLFTFTGWELVKYFTVNRTVDDTFCIPYFFGIAFYYNQIRIEPYAVVVAHLSRITFSNFFYQLVNVCLILSGGIFGGGGKYAGDVFFTNTNKNWLVGPVARINCSN